MESLPLILIADDEPEVLALYRAKLEHSDFRVVTAGTGEEAVQVATAEHPDLILMDVKMPLMDGVAAQQKLKDNPATRDIKVVFLTAFSDPERQDIDKELAKTIGAVDFIKKGINLDDFADKIRGYLAVK